MADAERVADCMRFILFKHSTRSLIKLSDIQKEFGKKMGDAKPLVVQVKKRFDEVFGFKLVETPTKQSENSEAENKAKKVAISFMLITGDELESGSEMQKMPELAGASDRDLAHMGLLSIVLAIIHGAAGPVNDEQIYRQLGNHVKYASEISKMEIYKGVSVKKGIDNLVKQMYLDKEKTKTGADGEFTYLYSIGRRTLAEGSQEEVNKFLAKDIMEVSGESQDLYSSQSQ